MAQQAVAAVLVVDLDLKGGQQPPDVPDDGVRRLIFDQAAVHRHDFVGALLVNAGDDPAVPQAAEGRMDLVPVVVRVLHAHSGPHGTDVPEKPPDLFFLFL